MQIKFSILYVGLIVLVNWGFSVVPLVEIPGGEKWPPMSLVVGFIFVARDFAQREIGHRVIIAMLIAPKESTATRSATLAALGAPTQPGMSHGFIPSMDQACGRVCSMVPSM